MYLLEDAGIDVNTNNSNKDTPLHVAAQTKSWNSLIIILDHLLKPFDNLENEDIDIK